MRRNVGFTRTVLGVTMVTGLALGVGCKGETVVKDNPETAKQLSTCEESLKEKVNTINTLNARIAELEKTAGDSDSPIVVNIEGEAMEIKAGAGRGPHGSKDPKGSAKDAELYEAFVSQLKRSRGAIKKCYQNALKKDTRLSARTITLQIQVDYKSSGSVKSATFSPRVSPQFNSCMDAVAAKWTLPGMPRPVSFTYNQTLTPE